MPEMGGIEATDYIRKNFPADKQPVIIALTADVFTENRERCLQVGMNDVLTKPINQHQLSETLTRYCS
jgi:CheY-like chemotaxis protein